ncbi:hypothetical protein ALT_0480 [Aspergillus lentulus]|uniref:Zn(2)-C6 fungal-type domain-containing protein n=1 Tax=Aspergillus lentulus TaxID=293939 RepID=A0AAN4PAV0_ASPLE|nr:hypothetical protein ALT_0480 [Aspergillus lentulus]GFG10870.1 hypothetical protein IFM61392_06620 [Aspergillus lentulus]
MATGTSTRRREVRACQRCRTLKVGCDKAKPACRRCIKAGASCVVRHTGSNESDRASTNGDTSILREDLDDSLRNRDELTGSTVSNENGSFHSPLSYHQLTSHKRNRNPVSCIRCRRLKVRCDRQQPCHRCTKAKAVCAYGRSSGIHHDSDGDSFADNSSAAARFAAWSGRFRTDTHWITLVREVENSLSAHGSGLAPHSHTSHSNRPDILSDLPWGLKKVESKSVLLERMPTRVVGEKLISMYIDVVEKTHHFLDLPAFQQQLLLFWDHPMEAEDGWLALLFVIFYLGQEAHRTVACGSTDLLLSVPRTEFLEVSQGFLHRTSFVAHPNLDIIRTLCLMVVAKQMVQMSCSAMDTSWCLTGLILRIAMSMGLHSAQVDDPRLGKAERQTLNVLWTSIMYLNLRQSVLTGMPILLRPRDYTCASPPSINGCPDRALPRLNLEEETETFHGLFRRAVPLASQLLDLSHGPTRSETYEAIMHYTAETRHLLVHASETLRKSHPTTGEARQAIMLDILFRRLLLSVHRPFAHDERAPLRYPLSYWTSLDCALAILVHQRDLWEAPADNSPVSRSFARLFWPDFLVAALTLSGYLLRADTPLDPPPSSGYGGMPARTTLLDALRSCRDIWQLEKNRNICHSHAFVMIDRVVSALKETGPDSIPALNRADVESAIDAASAGVH